MSEKNKANDEVIDSLKSETRAESSQIADETWEKLSQDWQSQPYQSVNAHTLLAQTRKRTLWAKFLLAMNVVATISFIILVVVMWLGDSEDKTTLTYLIFAAVGSVIFVYYEIKIRLAAWQHVSASPNLAIVDAIKGIESSINYIRLTKFSCWFLVPSGSWYVFEMAKQGNSSVWLGLSIFNVSIAAMWGISDFFHRKRQTELTQLKNILTNK